MLKKDCLLWDRNHAKNIVHLSQNIGNRINGYAAQSLEEFIPLFYTHDFYFIVVNAEFYSDLLKMGVTCPVYLYTIKGEPEFKKTTEELPSNMVNVGQFFISYAVGSDLFERKKKEYTDLYEKDLRKIFYNAGHSRNTNEIENAIKMIRDDMGDELVRTARIYNGKLWEGATEEDAINKWEMVFNKYLPLYDMEQPFCDYFINSYKKELDQIKRQNDELRQKKKKAKEDEIYRDFCLKIYDVFHGKGTAEDEKIVMDHLVLVVRGTNDPFDFSFTETIKYKELSEAETRLMIKEVGSGYDPKLGDYKTYFRYNAEKAIDKKKRAQDTINEIDKQKVLSAQAQLRKQNKNPDDISMISQMTKLSYERVKQILDNLKNPNFFGGMFGGNPFGGIF